LAIGQIDAKSRTQKKYNIDRQTHTYSHTHTHTNTQGINQQ